MRLAFGTAAALAVAASFATSARAEDKPAEKAKRPDVVVMTEGGKVVQKPGVVESADYDKVVFVASGGRKADLPAADVVEIKWSDAPAGYEDGTRALAAGDLAAAQKGFRDALNEKDVKPDLREWLVEFGNAGLGRALLGLGEADKAAEAYAKARGANAKSMILDQILSGLAEAEMMRNKGEAAAKAAEDLVAAAKSARRPSWELDAYMLRAKGELQAGDWTGAASAYDDAIRFAENAEKSEKNDVAKKHLQRAGVQAATLKGWALVAKAEASKSTADFDAARSYFDGLASKHPNEPSVRASATNASGVAKLSSGDAKGALRLFAETEVVHFRAGAEVARALWYQAECWRKLGNEQARADRLKDLKEQFPGSEWARRAQ
jgi:tetratricopeptide (TPR) repeat protein